MVKDAMTKGATASNWTAAVSRAVGGKAGGKGATSLGSGNAPENVDEALSLATKYLEDLGI